MPLQSSKAKGKAELSVYFLSFSIFHYSVQDYTGQFTIFNLKEMMPFIGLVSVCFYDFDFVQCNVYIEAYKLLHRSVQKMMIQQSNIEIKLMLFLYLYI